MKIKIRKIEMKKFMPSFMIALIGISGSALSKPTEADYERAKKNYTVEILQKDAFCGEASIVWGGESAALTQGWIKERGEYLDKKPEGTEALHYNRSVSDLTVLGMRVAGITKGGQVSGVSIVFDRPSIEVFSKLPGKPKMTKAVEYPGTGVTAWAENKGLPRMLAFSYKDFTIVSCERGTSFVPTMK
jgi:hypothetical protein